MGCHKQSLRPTPTPSPPSAPRDYDTRMFHAWDASHTRKHEIVGPPHPRRITHHVLSPKEWGVRADKARSLLDTLLRGSIDGMRCEQCDELSEDSTGLCGVGCYHALVKTRFATLDSMLEVRRSTLFSYGVYVQPGQRIESGQVLGEYLGRLRPMKAPYSRYVFDMNGEHCHIDAEVYGNWTRFVNSHCNPNVVAVNTMAGKRNMVLFTACRSVGPGEQLFLDYGREYFEGAGMRCLCDAQPRPHLPDDKPCI